MNPYALTVEDVMMIYGMSRTAVYVTASRARWRRFRDERNRVCYHVDDVGRTLSRAA